MFAYNIMVLQKKKNKTTKNESNHLTKNKLNCQKIKIKQVYNFIKLMNLIQFGLGSKSNKIKAMNTFSEQGK